MTIDVLSPVNAERVPRAGGRLSASIVAAGAIVVVLIATTLNTFELDRFFVPKELALHITAVLATLFALRAMRHLACTRVDSLLALYVGVSALSALFATNHWVALRALAISASSLLLFWCGRAARSAGRSRALVGWLAAAAFAAAFGALLQTYGVDLVFFSENRAPGGTLGNRNFVAHVAAFGWPLLMLAALRARTSRAFVIAAIGVTAVTMTLTLTRSRAAWLAFAIAACVFLLAIIFAPALRREGRTWRRIIFVTLISTVGVGAALLIPNSLHWRGRNPYLESVKRVADYQGGSGHGRVIQYRQSLVMSLHHPILGVGPGNWPVVYPKHAARHDPSLDDNEEGMTSNPWPSSDWVAFVSERGVAAAALLALALLGILSGAFAQLRNAVDPEDAADAVALLGVMTAAGIAGLFDAVLLLAVPAIIVWPALGALSGGRAYSPSPSSSNIAALGEETGGRAISPPSIALALIIAIAGALHSAAQVSAMNTYATTSDRAALTRAAQIDPGNYRLQLRLARIARSREARCEHARAAHELFPSAAAARQLASGCR